jgi:hypothetical protein
MAQSKDIFAARHVTPAVAYDYINQAWVKDGRYIACGHPESMACGCYGRVHAGRGAEWDYLSGTAELTPVGVLVRGSDIKGVR